MIDKTERGAARSRVGECCATYYQESRRVIVVADKAGFGDVLAAVTELRDEVC